jgi:hypothetical protein
MSSNPKFVVRNLTYPQIELRTSTNDAKIIYADETGSQINHISLNSNGGILLGDDVATKGSNLEVTGNLTATSFIGDGSSITNLTSGSITDQVSVQKGGTSQNALAINKILVGDGTNPVKTPAGLHWDDLNNRLGINTSAPNSAFHVVGDTTHHGKIVVMDSQHGGSDRGIYLWNQNDSDWGIYISKPGVGKSMSGGEATSGYELTNSAVRFRANSTVPAEGHHGFIFENELEENLLSIRSSDGKSRFTGDISANTYQTINDGSQTLPAISWASDTDTGLYRPGTDIMAFATGGTERLRLNATGNIEASGSADIAGSLNIQGNTLGLGNGTVLKWLKPNNVNQRMALYLNANTDSNWAFYMAESGTNNSLSGGVATSGHNFSLQALRMRTAKSDGYGFIFENEAEELLMSINAFDKSINMTGDTYLDRSLYVGIPGTGDTGTGTTTRATPSTIYLAAGSGDAAWGHCALECREYGNLVNEKHELLLFMGNDPSGEEKTGDRVRIKGPQIRFDTYDYSLNPTNPDRTTETTKMILNKYGNLGIGTISPTEQLHVIGNILASGSGTIGGNLNVQGNTLGLGNGTVLKWLEPSNGNQRLALYLNAETNSSWAIYMAASGPFNSLSGGNATTGHNFSSQALRMRTFKNSAYGFIFENSDEELLMSINSFDKSIHMLGNLNVFQQLTASTFTGNGAALTNLTAANLTGIVTVENGGTGAGTHTDNKLLVGNGTNALQSPTNLHWDDVNEYLGVGTSTPSEQLHVIGNMLTGGSGTIGGNLNIQGNNLSLGNNNIIKWLAPTNSEQRTAYYFDGGSPDWGIYMARPGVGNSLNGDAVSGYNFNSYSLRFRANNLRTHGFIFENSSEQLLMSINANNKVVNITGPLVANNNITANSFTGDGSSITNLTSGNLSGIVSVPNGGTGVGTHTDNKLLVGNGTNAIQSPTNLHWDATNTRLGINTSTPNSAFHVVGDTTNHGKIVVMDGQNGGSGRGIHMWTANDSDWGIYMANSRTGQAMDGGNAISGDFVPNLALRFRVGTGTGQGVIFENASGGNLLSMRTDDGLSRFPGNLSANTFQSIANGSETSPSISWADDTNTGLFRANEDVIAFSTAGEERARFNETGLFGIGTISPTEQLHVIGNILASGSGTIGGNLNVQGNTLSLGSDTVLKWLKPNNVNQRMALYLNANTDSNWAFYMAESGTNNSLSGGVATSGHNFSLQALRMRTAKSDGYGFIFENEAEELLMSINAFDKSINMTGDTYIDRSLYVGTPGTGVTEYGISIRGTPSTIYLAAGFGDSAWSHCALECREYGDVVNEQHELLLFMGNDPSDENDAGGDRVRIKGPQIRFDTYDYELNSTNPDRTTETTKMILNKYGNLGINNLSPGYRLHVGGDVYATGNIIGSSDRRLKTNIVPIQDALSLVNKMTGYRFNRLDWKQLEVSPDKAYLGFVAQEVSEIIPELVEYDEKNDQYGVNYPQMIAVLTEALKIVDKKNITLEQKQIDMDIKQKDLEDRLIALESNGNSREKGNKPGK